MDGLVAECAVVIGAGIAGLAAAKALEPYAREVVVVERDALQTTWQPRKGVPQGNHLHLLLIAGSRAAEQLFPGVLDELSDDGAIVADSGADLAFFLQGGWMPRASLRLPTRLQTRPFLEGHLRERLRVSENITFRNAAASGIEIAGGRVRGVYVAEGGGVKLVESDIVVDASGRGSRVCSWLRSAGYDAPPISTCDTGLGYASRFIADLECDFDAMLIYPEAPHQQRGGALYRQEGEKWIVTLTSYGEDELPQTDGAFLDFARSLTADGIAESLAQAKAVSAITTLRAREAYWNHFERLRRMPRGLVVLGDAYCRFNPIFGQGMSAALRSAAALAEVLERHGPDVVHAEFPSKAARIVRDPWDISTTLDLAFPSTKGRRLPGLRILHRYLASVFRGLREDPAAYANFMKVLHLLEQPSTLFAPRQALAAVRGAVTP